MATFQRNLTSILLEKSLSGYLKHHANSLNILEIGCGDGNITRAIAAEYKNHKYFASDISSEAISKANDLCNDYLKSYVQFKVSNGFGAWKNQKFDVILCDISAINQQIAEISEWYIGVKCETGMDGLKVIRPVIKDVKEFLNPNGVFILPTISLSDTGALNEILSASFNSITLVENKDWPMPKELAKKIAENNIPGKGITWHTKSKFGIEIANTGVFLCKI